MKGFHRILLGMSHTPADNELLRYAALAARACCATTVSCVHVLPLETRRPEEGDAASPRDQVLAALEETVRGHFTGAPPETRTRVEVLKGPRLDRLLHFALEQEADVTLVGHRPGRGRRRALALRLAMKAPCPVWVVPERAPATLQRILVPVDFSDPSADALRLAASLAETAGGVECFTLHVASPEPTLLSDDPGKVPQTCAHEAYVQWLASAGCSGIRAEPLFESGRHVGDTVVRVAGERQVDLIVMGTRGRSPSAAILLGSTTEHTILDSPIPVLAVKASGAPMGLLEALLEDSQRGPAPQFN
jgi:nucleotide-binding universal stress UspA family protein